MAQDRNGKTAFKPRLIDENRKTAMMIMALFAQQVRHCKQQELTAVVGNK